MLWGGGGLIEELKGGPLLFVSLIIIFLFATTKLYTATSNARIQSIYLLMENLLIRSLSNQSFPFIYKEFYKKMFLKNILYLEVFANNRNCNLTPNAFDKRPSLIEGVSTSKKLFYIGSFQSHFETK